MAAAGDTCTVDARTYSETPSLSHSGNGTNGVCTACITFTINASAFDRVCCRPIVGKSRYPGDSRGKSVARRPWRETDPGKISFVICNRRNRDSHIFEIHRWADNPSAERRQYGQCSWAIISRGPMAAERAKMGRDEFKSKKAGMPAKSRNN